MQNLFRRLAVACAMLMLAPTAALAVPSFAIQTDQPCSACHIGAFGPRLKQQGRDFKLFGYVANDTKPHGVPVSFLAQASFAHTTKDQIAAVAAGYDANDNLTFNELSAFYAGRVFDKVGAFAEVVYDAIEKSVHWEDLDVRRAWELNAAGRDSVIGVTINNGPTVSDQWNIAPGWAYPFVDAPLAQVPAASPISDAIPGTVLGIGSYGMWDDILYLEGDVYQGLDPATLRLLGSERINGGDRAHGAIWYWRAALQHEFDDGRNYGQIGVYGIEASLYPGNITAAGSDRYSDIGFDATWQWTDHPELSTSDVFEAHMLYLTENARLSASSILAGTNAVDHLNDFRAELTYSIDATWTPTIQYFHLSGTADPVRWPTFAGSPDSAGWRFEFDYVPWGKPESPWAWLGARLALQYTAYTKFDGTGIGASNFNTLLLHLTLGAAVNQ